MKRFIPVIVLSIACLPNSVPAQPAPPSPAPAAIYARMVAAMNGQPAPASISYDETFTPEGLGLRILNVGGTAVVHLVYSPDRATHVFHVTESSGQNAVSMVDAASGQRYVAAPPFWSMMWQAGARGAQAAALGTVIGSAREKMIDDLATANGAYTPSYAGVENLNGVAVYHLHLAAQDPASHPLTDVYVDEKTYLAYKVIGGFRDTSVTTVTGDVILNFGEVAGFWLVASGQVDATVHAFLRTVSGTAAFSASRVVASGTSGTLPPPTPQAPQPALSARGPISRTRN